MTERVEIAPEDPTSSDAKALIAALSAELAARYDFADDGSGAFSAADVQVARSAFLVARLDGRPVGCGALRPMAEPGFEDAGEIKRMYVAAEARGRRIGALILAGLESLAREFGYARVVLETGDAQPEAIRLYERAGYEPISAYGAYVGESRSICYAKPLSGDPVPDLDAPAFETGKR